ncbi:chaplin [Streptomyces sp. RKND-216]|uniref:Chaplin n=1 Tax=Streptomyces hazeniae TaxID=3075538 RepID=A0ABU2NYD7_9ACTN|nr:MULTISPECIES: chaplin [unclassified Streptomyces]MDT0381715.1 chaplin [Streptomyces sp. DSM 42041]THA27068.1 chaplin [Streptomyces sp. RKND-216]
MKNMKRIATVAVAAAGLAVSGAGAAVAHDGASADAVAANSPGVLSGNVVQVPVDVPVQVCGNTVNVIALLNPAFGNTCVVK